MCLMLVNQEYSLILALSGTATTRQLPDISPYAKLCMYSEQGRRNKVILPRQETQA